ncbi:MAG: YbaN family protein [Bacteroidales bacterium]|jgi:uncharacterized membrane protein YbaN (DUF454 family)|nr:YbaN family protein [Bacteroidales bacterium]
MKRIVLLSFGIISLLLGVLGIFLPLLPTTPFLLLSSFLFIRSSNKLYLWLINNPLLGKYIIDFQQEKTIPLKVKLSTIIILWTTISISAFVFVKLLWIKLLLFAIAIGVTWHILSFKTKKRKKE